MLSSSRFFPLMSVLLFWLFTAQASAAYIDPPGRVAFLSHTRGEVSYSPAGEDEWLGVVRNRPLIRGDRLWTDRGARAEFQVSSAAVRLGSDTSVEILDLGDQIAQIKMTQGTLNLSVRRIYPGQTIEVATPMLAFAINRAGRYRIDVNPRNAVTTVVVWDGAGEAYGDNSSFRLRAGDTVRFYDTDLRDYEMFGLPREDDFDRYCRDRDQRLKRSASLRYLGDDVVGYAELDAYGSWRSVRGYGNVWFPGRVDANWAPYRDGHWVWQEPWGWTWVDDAPWGFAPSHYGRWVNVSSRWGWVPGPRNVRPVYAPALVAFVGGSGWSVSISLGGSSPIGWFPLGPREVYVPSYQASHDYFNRVNVTNTVINNTTITNVYKNYSSGTINVDHARYANRTVAGAVTVVPSSVFVNAQPVRSSAIRLDHKAVTTGEIMRVAPIAPSARSVIGPGKAAEARPSREAFDRQVFVRNAPPPGERPFAAREQQLQKHPGRVPEPAVAKPVRDRDDNTAQKVRVIGEQPGAVDARAAGSRRGVDRPDTPAAAPAKLKPLDRSVEPSNEPGPRPGDRGRDKEQKSQRDVQQQQQAAEKQQAVEKQQAERKRETDMQQQEQRQRDVQQQQQAAEKQQAVEKQQAEHKRQTDTQQQEQRQRDVQQQQQAAEKQQAVEKEQVERKRQADTQQQVQRQRDVQQQQQAAEKQQAVEKQQAKRKRQTDTQQQEQQRQRDVQQQQQAAEKQQAVEKQQAEHKRQTDTQQQEQRQRDVQQQQQAAEKQQAVEKQQVERKRQADTQQQVQRQRDVQQQQQAAEKQQAVEKQQVEHKRQVQTEQERQAECERLAIEQHQDASQCQRVPPPKESSGNPNRGNRGR